VAGSIGIVPDAVEDIRGMYLAGVSHREITRRTGCSMGLVVEVCRDLRGFPRLFADDVRLDRYRLSTSA
jgi:hypothetical protein